MRHHQEREAITVPRIGDRVERVRAGVSQQGTVHYADQLQALIKWDNGSSSSLRLDRDRIRIIQPAARRDRQTDTKAKAVEHAA
jgi:hypothetical protein